VLVPYQDAMVGWGQCRLNSRFAGRGYFLVVRSSTLPVREVGARYRGVSIAGHFLQNDFVDCGVA